MKAREKYKEITQQEYLESFQGGAEKDEDKARLALEHALDIRKFEIDLYWKRAAYFWTLIGADLVGYGALQVSATQNERTDNLSILLSCMGIIFSFAWFCVSKGSKQWQENWENHVDMLENQIIGPLYKTVLSRPKASSKYGACVEFLTGPGPLSVSKINQIIGFFVTILWAVLLLNSLGPFSTKASIERTHLTYVLCTLACCGAFLTLGRTSFECPTPVAKLRTTTITPLLETNAATKKKEIAS
jgi:hypothetical protein